MSNEVELSVGFSRIIPVHSNDSKCKKKFNILQYLKFISIIIRIAKILNFASSFQNYKLMTEAVFLLII